MPETDAAQRRDREQQQCVRYESAGEQERGQGGQRDGLNVTDAADWGSSVARNSSAVNKYTHRHGSRK